MAVTLTEKDARQFKKHLVELIDQVSCVLVSVDLSMQGPSTPERGQRIAAAMSVLQWARDSAAHFGLNQSFAVIKRNAKKAVAKRRGAQK